MAMKDSENGSYDDEASEISTHLVEMNMTLNTKKERSANRIWGWLQPNNSRLHALALEDENYTFGRHSKCDYVFQGKMFDEAEYTLLSKYHFQICKVNQGDKPAVFIYDLSSNGVYVNRNKIPGQAMLEDNDEISLSWLHIAEFTFINKTDARNWMPDELRDEFILKKFLGRGTYGEVRLAHSRESNENVAIKKVAKVNIEGKDTLSEIQILSSLKHTHITSVHKMFESPDSIFMVLEYVPGDTLKARVERCNQLPKEDAKLIFYQLVLALEYLHERGVCHGDLKPENVLLDPREDGDLVKLSDFGMSKFWKETSTRTLCGTPSFIAPEVMRSQEGKYSCSVDIWSLGVCLFFCLSGELPFNKNRSVLSVKEQIIRGSYSMDGTKWDAVGPRARSMIRRTLVVNAVERITIQSLLSHPWFKDHKMEERLDKILRSTTIPSDEAPRMQSGNFKRPRREESS